MHRAGLAESWRSFRIAAWLGWQVESNWTDPLLFAVYSLVRPLAGAAILVVMYSVSRRATLIRRSLPISISATPFTCTWAR